jgi:hypothetical protein
VGDRHVLYEIHIEVGGPLCREGDVLRGLE